MWRAWLLKGHYFLLDIQLFTFCHQYLFGSRPGTIPPNFLKNNISTVFHSCMLNAAILAILMSHPLSFTSQHIGSSVDWHAWLRINFNVELHFWNSIQCSGSMFYIWLVKIECSKHVRPAHLEHHAPAWSVWRRSHLWAESTNNSWQHFGHTACPIALGHFGNSWAFSSDRLQFQAGSALLQTKWERGRSQSNVPLDVS